LHLTQKDAAILAAALRQYEPYSRPDDSDHGEELTALVRDITRLLGELRSRESAGGAANVTSPTAVDGR